MWPRDDSNYSVDQLALEKRELKGDCYGQVTDHVISNQFSCYLLFNGYKLTITLSID